MPQMHLSLQGGEGRSQTSYEARLVQNEICIKSRVGGLMKASYRSLHHACFMLSLAFPKQLFIHIALGWSCQVHSNSPVACGCLQVCMCVRFFFFGGGVVN